MVIDSVIWEFWNQVMIYLTIVSTPDNVSTNLLVMFRAAGEGGTD